MATARTGKTPGQTFALVFGAVYVLVGVLGFFVAEEFTGGSPDDKLILFPVNHLHNIVHLAIGAVLLAGSRTVAAAKQANTVVGAGYLLVAVLGFLGLDFMSTLLNINGPGSADNFLHLVSGALALYFGLADDRTRTTTTV
ncbi:MAG TPA: DUF4383 domain-containing protein [Actinomycetota bacterium]|nr:DUF4383 domain-containing protein [Actinomycetota bacterium]